MDLQDEDAFQASRSVMALGLRTVQAVPIAADGRLLGLLYLDSQRMHEPPASALSALARLGELAGAFAARQGA